MKENQTHEFFLKKKKFKTKIFELKNQCEMRLRRKIMITK